jgi:hypothetical protein
MRCNASSVYACVHACVCLCVCQDVRETCFAMPDLRVYISLVCVYAQCEGRSVIRLHRRPIPHITEPVGYSWSYLPLRIGHLLAIAGDPVRALRKPQIPSLALCRTLQQARADPSVKVGGLPVAHH